MRKPYYKAGMKILKFLAKKAGRKPKTYLEALSIDEKIEKIYEDFIWLSNGDADAVGLYFGFCYTCFHKVPRMTIGKIAEEFDTDREDIRKRIVSFLNTVKADLIKENKDKKEELKNARTKIRRIHNRR